MLNILQIDSEMTWRGGQNQLRLLMEGAEKEAQFHLACPESSAIQLRMQDRFPIVTINPRGLDYLSSAKKLAQYCRQHKIQLIDCQSSKAHSLALLTKLMVRDIKLVVHRRVDYIPSGLSGYVKYKSSLVNRYVAISSAIGEGLSKAGIEDSRIAVVKSAVDPAPFAKIDRQKQKQSICEALKIDPTSPLLINVAYHTDQKGHETLVSALAKLKKSGLPFEALLAGEGPLTADLKRQAEQLEVSDRLHFLGVRNDIPELLGAADILAFPSNFEGLGTSILDAIYSGCAVAATKVGGIPEMILHEQTGLLSPVGDAEAHYLNLKRLIEDLDLREQLKSNANEHIRQHFSLEAMVQGNLKIYRELSDSPNH